MGSRRQSARPPGSPWRERRDMPEPRAGLSENCPDDSPDPRFRPHPGPQNSSPRLPSSPVALAPPSPGQPTCHLTSRGRGRPGRLPKCPPWASPATRPAALGGTVASPVAARQTTAALGPPRPCPPRAGAGAEAASGVCSEPLCRGLAGVSQQGTIEGSDVGFCFCRRKENVQATSCGSLGAGPGEEGAEEEPPARVASPASGVSGGPSGAVRALWFDTWGLRPEGRGGDPGLDPLRGCSWVSDADSEGQWPLVVLSH